ncbi:MAG: DUF1028 domain-containing protein [Halanaerobium sp.]
MKDNGVINTFSIVAYDPKNEEWGVGVASKFLAVGSMVPWARAGVGAVATQAWGNPNYGPEGLKLLAEGEVPEQVIKILTDADSGREYRQLAVIDKNGSTSVHTGEQCSQYAGSIEGDNYAVQGNLLVSRKTIEDTAESFENTFGRLADRIIVSLEAGQKAGGDKRGRQAAALFVAKKGCGINNLDDRYIDLRVDDHKTPIQELKRLLSLFYEQRNDC